jgi:hypothetical protein
MDPGPNDQRRRVQLGWGRPGSEEWRQRPRQVSGIGGAAELAGGVHRQHGIPTSTGVVLGPSLTRSIPGLATPEPAPG